MHRFDVVRNKDSATRGRVPYFLVLQSDFLSHLSTCLVAPMMKASTKDLSVIQVLNPVFEVDGQRLVMNTPLMAGMRRSLLGAVVTNLESQRTDIIRAIDFLFSGF